MEVYWIRKRAELRELRRLYPQWSDERLSRHLECSRSWVQKWRRRLQGCDPQDETVLLSRSRARHTSPKQVTEVVEAKVIHLRETLSEQYYRQVGARTILYHLHKDMDLKALNVFIPKSASTIHAILVRYQRVPRPAPRIHIPLERAEPMQVWEIDFTDVSTAASTQTDKQQHQVEVLNIIDTGTAIVIDNPVSDHFDAKWSLIALIDVLHVSGCPAVLRFDRDPRFVASWGMDHFPSAFIRFLWCVGITPQVCPPRKPQKKPYIERFNRTQQEECIFKQRPADVVHTQAAVNDHRQFYNLDRPNQALSCGNRPPSEAYPQVPYLPRLPIRIDADAWLKAYHGKYFRRRVNSKGTVQVDKHSYYIGKRYDGQAVQLRLDAERKQFDVWIKRACVKQLNLKGLYEGELALDDYVTFILKEAESEEQRLKQRRHRRRAA